MAKHLSVNLDCGHEGATDCMDIRHDGGLTWSFPYDGSLKRCCFVGAGWYLPAYHCDRSVLRARHGSTVVRCTLLILIYRR